MFYIIIHYNLQYIIIIRDYLQYISLFLSLSSTILWSTETWAAASLFSVQPSSRVLPSDPAALVCQRSLMHLLHCGTSRWWVSYNMAQLLVQLGTLLCWWNILQHPDKVFPANLWLEIQLHACLSSFRASCTCLPSSSNAFIVYTMRWSWYQCSWLYVPFPAKHAWTQALEEAPG